MVEPQSSKLMVRVRFPSSPPTTLAGPPEAIGSASDPVGLSRSPLIVGGRSDVPWAVSVGGGFACRWRQHDGEFGEASADQASRPKARKGREAAASCRASRRPRSPSGGPRSTASTSSIASRRSPTADARVMMHVHGFGLSGRYLLPTAERLAGRVPHATCPTCPASAAAARRRDMLDIPDLAHAAARLPRRPRRRAGHARRQLDGLPGDHRVRPPLPRAHRARRARLARRRPVQSAAAPRDGPALAGRAARAHAHGAGRGARLRALRRAQHRSRLFRALTQYPSLRAPARDAASRRSSCSGERDPLLPGSHRVNEIASQTDSHVLVVLLEGAAHAINFSHPDELAHVIRLFMDDQPIVRSTRQLGPRPQPRRSTRSTAATAPLRAADRTRDATQPRPDDWRHEPHRLAATSFDAVRLPAASTVSLAQAAPRLRGLDAGAERSMRRGSCACSAMPRRAPQSVSSRRTFAGTPATSDPSGMTVPSSTTAPPATRHPVADHRAAEDDRCPCR